MLLVRFCLVFLVVVGCLMRFSPPVFAKGSITKNIHEQNGPARYGDDEQHPDFSRDSHPVEDGVYDEELEDNGIETGYQEILVDAGPFGVSLGAEVAKVLFKTGPAAQYFIRTQNMDDVPVSITVNWPDGTMMARNVSGDRLTYGIKIRLEAETVYTLDISPASPDDFGRTADLMVTTEEEDQPETQPRSGDAHDANPETITPFADEAVLMDAVEEDPTAENAVRLAAMRAARSSDLLAYAEEHQDGAAFDLALRYAESAAELDPDSTQIRLLMAVLYSRAQEVPLADQLAEGLLVEILDTEPRNVEALRLLSELYFNRQRFADAVYRFEQLLAVDSRMDGRQLAMMVDAWAAAGMVRQGRQLLDTLLGRNGADPHLNLAAALLARHDRDTGTALSRLDLVIADSAADKRYRLYARQLRTLWEGEVQ